MRHRLPAELESLLVEVIRKYHPERVDITASADVERLPHEQLMAIRELLGSELCETGFGLDDEPNTRGLKIEKLIDWIGWN